MKKRIISLMLLITFVFPFYAFAEEAETPVSNVYAEQTEMLKALGIWDSVGKSPAEELSRGDFAVIIMNVIGVGNLTFGDVSFLDVEKSRDDYNAIAFVKSYGVMNGMSEYSFDPDRTITYNEAIKTLLSAMGYDVIANNKGGYPVGYLTQASTLGFKIYEGNLTREKAADMLADALDVYILSAIGVEMPGSRILYSAENKETILSVYHDIEHVKGQMTDNGLTTLSAPSNLDEDHVKIGGKVFACDDPSVRRALGSELEFYYKEIDGENTVLWWKYNSKNEPLVLNHDMLAVESGDFTKTKIVYYEGERKKTVNIDPRASFIYNEIAYPAFTVADMKITNGTLTLYDGDGDNVYDILYADVYRSFRVTTTDNAKEEFQDDFNQVLNIAEYETVEIFNIYNVLVNASTIVVNDVLSAFASKNKEYLKIRISNSKDNLVYQSVSMDTPKKYTMGDTEYKLTEYLQEQVDAENFNLDEFKTGEKYRVYLDFNNDIAAFDLTSNIDAYAYFVSAKKQGVLTEEINLQVVLENGQVALLPCADKIRINKGDFTKASDILSLDDLKDGNGDWQPQLVKIKTNSKGALYEIETAPKLSRTDVFTNVGFDPYRFSMVFENNNTNFYTSGRNMIGGGGKQYSITANTVLFLIPPDGDMDYVETIIGVPTDLPTTYMKGYDADASYSLGAVVVQLQEDVGTTDKTRYETYLYIVEGVSEVMNEDGEILKQIKAYSHSMEWKMVEQRAGVYPDDIKAGDIVRLAVDKYDRVTRCTKLVSTDPRPAPNAFNLADLTRTRASYNGSASVVWGYPVGLGTNSITVSTDENGGSIIHVPFYSSMSTFIEFDVKNKTCKSINKTQLIITASLNEETGLFDIPDKDTMVLITTSSSGAYDLIVMRFGE